MQRTNPRLKNRYGMVTSEVMRDPSIAATAKVLYAYLCTYADPILNTTNVGVSRMTTELGVTESTIKRCLKTLLHTGVITRERTARSRTFVTTLIK